MYFGRSRSLFFCNAQWFSFWMHSQPGQRCWLSLKSVHSLLNKEAAWLHYCIVVISPIYKSRKFHLGFTNVIRSLLFFHPLYFLLSPSTLLSLSFWQCFLVKLMHLEQNEQQWRGLAFSAQQSWTPETCPQTSIEGFNMYELDQGWPTLWQGMALASPLGTPSF